MFNVLSLEKRRKPKKDNVVSMDGHGIKILIGLGNPGKAYNRTYHNTGFLFLDSMFENSTHEISDMPPVWDSMKLFRYTEINNLTLVKTNVLMNNSGRAVKAALKYFNVLPQNLLVVHDDSDIVIGNYKFSVDRGSAGHKGIESITQTLKTNTFPRLRIGIRNNNRKAGDFVLKHISKSDSLILEETFREIRENLLKI